MSVSGFLTFLAQLLFVALSAIALIDYFRHPNPRRRDFALLACALGIPLGITLLNDQFGIQTGLLDLAGALILFSQPYFLFRLLQYYRPNTTWERRAVLLGMILTWVTLFVFMESFPRSTQAIIFGYAVIVDGYCTVAYYRGFRNSTGTLRRRIYFIALSSGLFTLAVAGNVINALLPAPMLIIGAVGLAVTAVSAVLYYFAFVPPRWLQRAWQFEDLSAYILQPKLSADRKPTIAESIQQMCVAATQALNGLTSAVIEWDAATAQWKILYTSDPTLIESLLLHGQRIVDEAWQQGQPRAIYLPDMQDKEERKRLEAVGAQTWLLVPIQAPERGWGMLLLLLRHRSLFIDDDLRLLELFTQQCAIVLENSRLFDELQGYSQQLEARVQDRTAQLAFLADASRILTESMEYAEILKRLAHLVVPQIADWCSVNILDDGGKLQRLAVVHADPSKQALALEFQHNFPPSPDAPQGAYTILQTGKSRLYPVVTTEILEASTSGPEMRAIIHKLGFESAMLIPLIARGRALGSFALVMAGSGRHYATSDLALAEDLARRAALLIDNAKLHAETQKINVELEHRVQERTAHLTAVNKELEAFSYSVSHDLRAPLRAVDGFSQALLEDYGGELDEMGQDFLQRIRVESQRMGHLIDDLLGLSHFTRTEMHMGAVDLSRVAREIAATLKGQEPDRDVVFSIQSNIVTFGDERLLRVALQNLIGNAWKFTAKQPLAHIEFGASNGDRAHTRPEYYVRDNGAGFNMAYVNKLFGAFQRLHAMTEYAGTGIGLATVQRIIHRHGGSIRAEGEINQGATFYFTLGESL